MDILGIFIFGVFFGLTMGVALVRYGFGLGVRIVDRVQRDLEPFGDDADAEIVQTHTDGSELED